MFFPFWEWEGYINTKSQAIDINDITKAEKEQKIYIYILKKTSIYFWMNSNSLLIMIHFKIYKVHSQLTEINWLNINIFVLQVHIICYRKQNISWLADDKK